MTTRWVDLAQVHCAVGTCHGARSAAGALCLCILHSHLIQALGLATKFTSKSEEQ